MADQLEGATEEELLMVEELRARVPQLQDCPDHIKDDMNLLRFLRGFGGLEQATQKLHDMLAWRAEKTELLQTVLDSTPAGITCGNMDLLPYADKVLPIMPLRYIPGKSAEGLPMNCVYIGQVDLARFGSEVSDLEFESYIIAFMEQRAMVLHALKSSPEHEGRMAKFVELRDLDMLSVTTFMSSPRLVSRIKNVMVKVQANYPETSHQIHILHPGSTFSTLFGLISTFMNQRQLDKINVHHPADGSAVQVLASIMDVQGVFSWVSLRGQGNGPVHLKKGERKYVALRMDGAGSVRVSASSSGGDTPGRVEFVNECGDCSVLWSGAFPKQAIEQAFEVGAGVVVCTVDNTSSWWGAADLIVSLTSG